MAGNARKALLVTQFYRPELLGSGPFCADLAEWLTKRGWEVTVIAGLPHYPDPDVFAAERAKTPGHQEINGVRVERVRARISKKGGALSRILSELSFFLGGLRHVITGRVKRHDLVISLCPSIFSVALGAVACRRRGRHVAIVHDIQSGLAKGLKMVSAPGIVTVMRIVERMVFNRTDLLTVLTREMADQLRENGIKAPIDFFPIWVDLDRFAEAIEPPNGPVKIIYSGNFGKKQGLGQIVTMADVLQRTRPEMTIIMRGRGNQAEPLRQQIESHGLTNIRLEELLPDEALYRGLMETDIHLVPQMPDAAPFALPSKIFNIMAAGRPFVATAGRLSPLWGLQRASGAFICVPPNDPSAFAEAVLRLADDPGLRRVLGERGKQFVARHNDKSKVLEAFEARIEKLCVHS
ncbi:MAG TPA: glycosyltransferase family 4 protein [Magnetospirillaceae bacterium]